MFLLEIMLMVFSAPADASTLRDAWMNLLQRKTLHFLLHCTSIPLPNRKILWWAIDVEIRWKLPSKGFGSLTKQMAEFWSFFRLDSSFFMHTWVSEVDANISKTFRCCSRKIRTITPFDSSLELRLSMFMVCRRFLSSNCAIESCDDTQTEHWSLIHSDDNHFAARPQKPCPLIWTRTLHVTVASASRNKTDHFDSDSHTSHSTWTKPASAAQLV